MIIKVLRTSILVSLILGVLGFVVILVPTVSTCDHRHPSLATAGTADYALVFGAGYYADENSERLYTITRHRVEAAVELYRHGQVKKILVSGDNSVPEYNEPAAMIRHALSLGVNPDHICADYAGRSTYDSCYRAKEIFNVTNAIAVTQAYHLPRAVYLCREMGLSIEGLEADNAIGFDGDYDYEWMYKLREIPASLKALWEAHVLERPAQILGEPETECRTTEKAAVK